MDHNDLIRWTRLALRVGLTVLVTLCLFLRLTRMAESWESVKQYYGLDLSRGLVWFLLELAFFTGPFLTALAVLLSLWLRGRAALSLALAGLCGGLLFALGEGLTRFARAMNGNGGYVGAEPLLSLAVCAVAGVALLFSRRRRA